MKENNFRIIVGVFVLGICATLESWALIILTATQREPDANSSKDISGESDVLFCNFDTNLIAIENALKLSIVEFVISYFLPFFLILVVDISVFLRVYLWQPKSNNDVRRRIVLTKEKDQRLVGPAQKFRQNTVIEDLT